MNEKYYPLGGTEDNRIVKIMRIIFGFACIAMAIYWTVYNLDAPENRKAMWITVIFILGFGLYQIWAGLGKAVRYISFGDNYIRIRQNSMTGPQRLSATDLNNIIILPLSVVFVPKEGKKTILRMGSVNYETNEKIIDEVAAFSENNNIPFEVKDEKIF